MTTQLNILAKSEALKASLTFANLYAITIKNEQKTVAIYQKDGKEVKLSFSDYDKKTQAFAAFLDSAISKKEKGQFIAIAVDTCPEWIPMFYGAMMAGFNTLLLDAALSDDMTAYLLNQAGAHAIIVQKEKHLASGVHQILAGELFAAPPSSFVPQFADKVALCTSGTTSTSRIFVFDGEATCNQVLNSVIIHQANKRMISDKDGRSLAFLPFHHVLGFMVCALWVPYIGYASIFLQDRSPQTILSMSQKYRVNILLSVPLLANNLAVSLDKKIRAQSRLKQIAFRSMKNLSLGIQRFAPSFGIDFARKVLFKSVISQILGTDVDCIILGGSHTPSEHLKTLAALGYYTVCGFGMTETAITSVETTLNLATRVSGSVGLPLEGCEYKVAESGEMRVRSRSIHTARLIDGVLAPPDTDAEGYYHTGDIVRLEKGGRMFVEGRIKDVIINESGENVYPDELEDKFSDIGGIDQFCVLGLPKKDKRSKYEDIALVLSVGARIDDNGFLDTLRMNISKRNNALPVLKKVSRVVLTDGKLPVVNNIKVKRIALRDMIETKSMRFIELDFKQKAIPVTEEKPKKDDKADIRNIVLEIYADALSCSKETIGFDAHFLDDLGGDSLQVLSITTQVEERLGVLIPSEDYQRCITVNQMTELLYEELHDIHRQDRTPRENVTAITRFEDTPEYQAFNARQQALMKDGKANPYFVCHESPLMDVSIMDGHEVLNFGSYNYVGMSGRKEVMEAAKKAIEKYGTSASGSRLLAGEKKLYQELENKIAEWKHAEKALVLVGGHSTNVTIVGNFCNERDLIVYDALAHNSIEQGCRLSKAVAKPFPHNDSASLESILKVQRHKFEKVLIIIEGAYSMDGDIANVPEFVRIKEKYGCFLMVDEAHSACVIGKTGGGVDEYFNLPSGAIDIKMGTLSKGLGTCGGYLAGSESLINYLKYNLPGFVFSVGISPPLAAATLEAIRLLQEDPTIMTRMAQNISCFVEEAKKRNLNTCLAKETAIIPILVGSDEAAFHLSNRLRENGVFVPPAVYPAVPKGKARLRFCVISEHNKRQIIDALDILVRIANEDGIVLPSPG